ncbi:hypothetical protein [Nostoc sp. CALU 546]
MVDSRLSRTSANFEFGIGDDDNILNLQHNLIYSVGQSSGGASLSPSLIELSKKVNQEKATR